MVKKIIHVSDIHIRNFKRSEEYKVQLQKFIDECKEIISKHGENEVRVVIAGDIVHSKTEISPECYNLTCWFLRELDNICKTIVIAGNHDFNMANMGRLDPISVIFSMYNFKQTTYLDKDLNYSSGCVVDDNIVWCLYSSFDGFRKPEIEENKVKNENKTYIGLFHGDVKNSSTDVGFVSENGYEPSYFDGIDFCLMGHIHKRQVIENDGVKLVYSGSLIQQDHGENINGHGYLVWDVENKDFEEVNMENNEYGFYTFKINSIDDIDNDLEELTNN